MRNRIVAMCLLAAALPAGAATLTKGTITIRYPADEAPLALRSLTILEAGLARYARELPPGPGPITVQVCGTLHEFKTLFGTPAAARIEGFARSRAGSIVIKSPSVMGPGKSYASILRHELIHVLLARNTNAGQMPRWLNEGIAMELSREYRWSSMYRVARMYTQGQIIPYGELPFVFAAPGNETAFGDAYAQSLSMTKFLRKRVGDRAFWVILRDLRSKTFAQTLRDRVGLGPLEFHAAWEASLWKIALASSIVSGISLFQVAALLSIVVYLKKRRQGLIRLRQWSEQEEEEDRVILPWDLEESEGPYPWEED